MKRSRHARGSTGKGESGSRPLVLVVEVDAGYREGLASELEAIGVQVEATPAFKEGLKMANALRPELVVIEVGPERDGERFDPIATLWEVTAAPVVALTGNPPTGEQFEEAARAGAVACLCRRDVSPRVAAGFVGSQLAALGRATSRVRRAGDAALDLSERTLRVRDKAVVLTRKQGEIIAALMEPPIGGWKEIPAIARRMFGEERKQSAVRKHINRLRVKFADAGLPATIETAHARGYRLVVARALNGERRGSEDG